MLLYSLLHLTGYDLPLDEIKNFRQWGSKTPGHPEYGLTPGVEVTTGPLGQGFANGVGMALAEKWLASHYNQNGNQVINHHVYGIVSDGDLQEGVSSEAASLAGTLRLGKIIYLYDDNDISIEGNTDIAFAENVAQRFQAYNWHVVGPIDGMDAASVDAAIRMAQAESNRPSLIICRTIIGYGSPNKAGTGAAHGEPLGEDEVKLTREKLGWPYEEPFTIPQDALDHFRKTLERGEQRQRDWQNRLESYRNDDPDGAARLEEALSGELPDGWDSGLSSLFSANDKPMATREAGGRVMNAIAEKVHAFMGGSADLAPSTKTLLKDHGHYGFEEHIDHNLHFGVREHAMGAIANGMALHGGVIPYTATFLQFSDYMRPAIRLGALMEQRVIYIFTHDSVALGEDGPTHQPIEHLMSLRLIPDLTVLRPADATETAEAWRFAMKHTDGPTALALSRQNLTVLDRQKLSPANGVEKGGYTLWEASSNPDVIIIGTGSEAHIALEAGRTLQQEGINARVVSMPSWELFDAQPPEYRNGVLPPEIKARVSIEAGTPVGWEHYVGAEGVAVGVPHFGASAPYNVIYEKFGLTAKRVIEEAKRLVK
jgi:transketolase